MNRLWFLELDPTNKNIYHNKNIFPTLKNVWLQKIQKIQKTRP